MIRAERPRFAWLLVCGAAALGASDPEAPSTERLPDGSELIHQRLPGRHQVAFRLVVRSGGSMDPPGKAGLAHILEHIIFQGAPGLGEVELFNGVRRTGAQINGLTFTDASIYTMDVPLEHWRTMVSHLVHIVHDPDLENADIERERRTIAVEDQLSSVFRATVFDKFLFPGMQRGRILLGSRKSRDLVQLRDIVEFYQTHYVPNNITYVTVGDVSADEAREVISAASRLPPSLPAEAPPRARSQPNIPLDERSPSRGMGVIFGFRVASLGAACDDAAALIEHRLFVETQVEKPMAYSSELGCKTLRSHAFLVAVMTSHSYAGLQLPAVLKRVFASVAERPISSAERRQIRNRQAALTRTLSVVERADRLGALATDARPLGVPTAVERAFRTPQLNQGQLEAFARQNFKPNNRFTIRLMPL